MLFCLSSVLYWATINGTICWSYMAMSLAMSNLRLIAAFTDYLEINRYPISIKIYSSNSDSKSCRNLFTKELPKTRTSGVERGIDEKIKLLRLLL